MPEPNTDEALVSADVTDEAEPDQMLVSTDSLSCPICFCLMRSDRTPVVLGCGHTMCKPCARQLYKPTFSLKKGAESKICCPTCRVSYRFPINTDPPVNYQLAATCDQSIVPQQNVLEGADVGCKVTPSAPPMEQEHFNADCTDVNVQPAGQCANAVLQQETAASAQSAEQVVNEFAQVPQQSDAERSCNTLNNETNKLIDVASARHYVNDPSNATSDMLRAGLRASARDLMDGARGVRSVTKQSYRKVVADLRDMKTDINMKWTRSLTEWKEKIDKQLEELDSD